MELGLDHPVLLHTGRYLQNLLVDV